MDNNLFMDKSGFKIGAHAWKPCKQSTVKIPSKNDDRNKYCVYVFFYNGAVKSQKFKMLTQNYRVDKLDKVLSYTTKKESLPVVI